MAKITDIINYFQHQCAAHPALLHTETPGSRIFEFAVWEDAWGDFRTDAKEKSYAVRLVLPELELGETPEKCATKDWQLVFFVGKYTNPRGASKTDIATALADCETVATDFLAKIMADTRNGNALFNHTGSSPDALGAKLSYFPKFGDSSYCAVMVSLQIANIFSLTTSSVAWTDGGLTP